MQRAATAEANFICTMVSLHLLHCLEGSPQTHIRTQTIMQERCVSYSGWMRLTTDSSALITFSRMFQTSQSGTSVLYDECHVLVLNCCTHGLGLFFGRPRFHPDIAFETFDIVNVADC